MSSILYGLIILKVNLRKLKNYFTIGFVQNIINVTFNQSNITSDEIINYFMTTLQMCQCEPIFGIHIEYDIHNFL